MNNNSILEQIKSSSTSEKVSTNLLNEVTIKDIISSFTEKTEEYNSEIVFCGSKFFKEYQKESLKLKKVVTLKEYVIIHS